MQNIEQMNQSKTKTSCGVKAIWQSMENMCFQLTENITLESEILSSESAINASVIGLFKNHHYSHFHTGV